MRNLTKEKKSDAVAEDSAARLPSSMKIRHYLGDAMGSVSTNIAFNLVGMLIYFYTDIIGLAVETVGMIMLVSKLLDAFTDIGMGAIVDRTKSRFGMARPWLLRMAAPALFSIIIIFTLPQNASMGFKTFYILITNILLTGVVFTAIAVPYGSLISLGTKDPRERSQMGIWRLTFAYLASALVNICLIPATNMLGGGQRAWIIMGVIFGLISGTTLLVAFFLTKERNRVSSKEPQKVPIKQGIALLFRNKYWVMLLAINVLVNLIYALANGASVYYAKYIFGDENLVAIIGMSDLAFAFLGFIMIKFVVKKLGNRNTVMLGMGIAILGCVLRALNPYQFIFGVITRGISTMGGASVLAVSTAMTADAIEYGEWKTGTRLVGLSSSASGFGAKLGSGLWLGAVGWLLAISGYDGTFAVQTPMANRMIIALNIYVPLICYVVIFVLMIFYKLDRDYAMIVTELDARRKPAYK